jgi:DNA-binding MarR family transcriptional regulator
MVGAVTPKPSIRYPRSDPATIQLLDFVLRLSSKRIKLTFQQIAILLGCYTNMDAQTVRGLVKAIGVPKSEVSRVLKRLENWGLIKRVIDPLDRRSVFILRTQRGYAQVKNLNTISKRSFEKPKKKAGRK